MTKPPFPLSSQGTVSRYQVTHTKWPNICTEPVYVLCLLHGVIADTSRQTYENNYKRFSSDVFFLNNFYPRLVESMHKERTPGHSSSAIVWKEEEEGAEGRGGQQSRGRGRGDRRRRRECVVESSQVRSGLRTPIWAKRPRCPCCHCPSVLYPACPCLGSTT